MAAFYHYLPGQVADEDILPALGPVLSDCTDIPEHATISRVSGKGPDGHSGVVVYPKPTHGEDPPSFQYREAQQTWLPVDGGKRWIGWHTEAPPAPEDLARRETYPGYQIKDEHERAWSVPIARSPQAVLGSLPTDYIYEGDRWQSQLKPAYQWLWDASGQVWDYFNDGATQSDDWLIDVAAKVLSVNYRLGPHEITALRTAGLNLLDGRRVQEILLALIDFDVTRAYHEKKTKDAVHTEPDSSSSSVGSADVTPRSAPVAAN